jgi:Spy/CpxP family protein refolding chaperone
VSAADVRRRALVLVAFGLVLAPAVAWAQRDAVDPVAAPRAAGAKRAAAPAGPAGHLWWDDPEVGAKLRLAPEQKQRMGAVYRKFQEARRARGDLSAAHEAYLAAVRAGDLAKASEQLEAWASKRDAELRGFGALRIEILSLLDAEQRRTLATLKPDLVGAPWLPRGVWIYAPPAARGARAKRPEPGAAP